MTRSASPISLIERHRIGGAAVDQDPAADDDGTKQAGDGDGGAERRAQRPRCDRQFAAPVQIGGHGDERNFERCEVIRHAARQELLAELLGVHLRHLAQAAGQQVSKIAGARRHQAAPRPAPVVSEGDDVVADVLAAHAGGIGRANQRTDRGAGDRGRLDAHLVERLDHGDMGKPARAAAAERQGKSFHVGLLTLPPRGRIQNPWPQAGAPVRLWPPHRRSSRCRRARGRRCPA